MGRLLYWAHSQSHCGTEVPSRLRTEYMDARLRPQCSGGVVSFGKNCRPPWARKTGLRRDELGVASWRGGRAVRNGAGEQWLWEIPSAPDDQHTAMQPSTLEKAQAIFPSPAWAVWVKTGHDYPGPSRGPGSTRHPPETSTASGKAGTWFSLSFLGKRDCDCNGDVSPVATYASLC
jgi:hypothetical protein